MKRSRQLNVRSDFEKLSVRPEGTFSIKYALLV